MKNLPTNVIIFKNWTISMVHLLAGVLNKYQKFMAVAPVGKGQSPSPILTFSKKNTHRGNFNKDKFYQRENSSYYEY